MIGDYSLQRRLGVGLTLGVTLLWLVAAIAAGLIMQHALNKSLDSALEETAQRILPLAVVEIANRETPGTPQHVAPLRTHKEYLAYLVRDAAGNILLQSYQVDPAIFAVRPRQGFYTTATHRIYGAAAVSNTLFIEVAEPLAYRRQATFAAATPLLLPLFVLVPLSLAGIWLFVRHSLRSVVVYRDAIEARGAGDLSVVERGPLPAEIAPIASAVNDLLDRLRRTLEAERSFTANSAHELRTPLATMLAQIQRLQREAPNERVRDRAAQIEGTLHGLVRLSEKLMQLAKAESGGLLAAAPQDMAPVLSYVVDDFRRTAGERLRLALPESGAVLSVIDPDAFAILTRNLIENALKHGAPDSPIEIRLTAERVLSVINAGQVVPPRELAHLTGRFVRAKSEAAGSGLGLAIANAIATGAGTTLTLASPAPGRADGFAASLQLP